MVNMHGSAKPTKSKSPGQRKLFIALDVILAIIISCVVFYFVANVLIVVECNTIYDTPTLCGGVRSPITLWELMTDF